jgi:hypothetical protein
MFQKTRPVFHPAKAILKEFRQAAISEGELKLGNPNPNP